MNWDQETYETIRRRINEIEMERKRSPRLSLQANADNKGIEDKRLKLSFGVLFGALACGCFLAFLLDKADKRVRDPEELSRHLRLPILGTIASSMGAKPAQFAEQVANDYQTIRTNLGLMGLEGIPRKLAVVSSTTREGKTTFSVNLATSLSRSGKRVLLIDGDLRKPDVVSLLDMGDLSRRSHKVVTEGGFEYTIYTVPTSGVDVLIPDVRRMHDVYELIASPMVAQRIEMMSQKYDHVIIDTPPILAFPDAIIWGRITGCAVLVSFAGRTLSTDLEATRFRLAQAKIRILGSVMNNVQAEQSYHRYGYGYYYRNKRSQKTSGVRNKKLLLPPEDGSGAPADESINKRAVVN